MKTKHIFIEEFIGLVRAHQIELGASGADHAPYQTALNFLTKIFDITRTDAAYKDEVGYWINHGSTHNLINLLRRCGYNSNSLRMFNAMAILDSSQLKSKYTL